MKRGRPPRRRRRYFRPKRPATWTDGEITINGVAWRGINKIDTRARLVSGFSETKPKSYTFETTFTISQPDPGDLRELAWASVVTPSTEAAGAFLVLVDALLERGLIRPPPTEEEIAEALERAVASGEPVQTTAAPKPLLDQAWEWVREATFPPLLERLRLALEAARPPPPPTLETATGSMLDMFAEQIFGLRRIAPEGEGVIDSRSGLEVESDAELRERCMAALRHLNPTRFDRYAMFDVDPPSDTPDTLA